MFFIFNFLKFSNRTHRNIKTESIISPPVCVEKYNPNDVCLKSRVCSRYLRIRNTVSLWTICSFDC